MTWTILTPAISAGIATIAFLFQVWNSVLTRNRESDRRDWERLQSISQILFKGQTEGIWAQKIAIQELGHLKTKREQVVLLSKEVLDWWNKQGNVDPGLIAELQHLFDKLRS